MASSCASGVTWSPGAVAPLRGRAGFGRAGDKDCPERSRRADGHEAEGAGGEGVGICRSLRYLPLPSESDFDSGVGFSLSLGLTTRLLATGIRAEGGTHVQSLVLGDD